MIVFIFYIAIGARSLFGYTDLHRAASSGNVSILNLLLPPGSNIPNVNSKTVDGGYTPLHLAASAGHTDCAEELLKYNGTDMNVSDAFGRTPLKLAKQGFKSDVVKLLQNYGKYHKVVAIKIINCKTKFNQAYC